MKIPVQSLVAALFGLSICTQPLGATTLVSADFDAGYSLGTINSQSGTNDVGLSGTWSVPTQSPDVSDDIQIVSGGLNYQVSGGGLIDGGTQALRYQQQSGDASVNTLLIRSLTGSASDTEVYFRMVIQLDTASAADDYVFWWLSTAGDTSNHLGDSLASGILGNNDSAQVTSTGRASDGAPSSTAQLLVARFTKDGVSGQYESVALWVNPAYGDSGTPIATSSDAAQTLSAIGGLGIQVLNMTGGSGYTMDSIALGTAWGDVVPVPEPGAYALIVSALVGVLVFFRRKR